MSGKEDLDDLREQLHAIQPLAVRRRMNTQIRDHLKATMRTPRGLRAWLLARPRSRRITLIAVWAAVTAVNAAARFIPAQPTVRVIDYTLVVLSVTLLVALAQVALPGRRRPGGRGPGVRPAPYEWGSSANEVCCRLCPVEVLGPGQRRTHSCVCHELTQSEVQPDRCTQCGRSFGARACGFTHELIGREHALIARELNQSKRKGS